MGDRIVIAFHRNGEYIISLYDHWGGDIFYNKKKRKELEENIRKLRENSNDFDNFLTMFIHWYREWRGFKPDEPYTIYLEHKPSIPDHSIICYDYSKDRFWEEEIEEFYRKRFGDVLVEVKGMPRFLIKQRGLISETNTLALKEVLGKLRKYVEVKVYQCKDWRCDEDITEQFLP